MTHGSEVECDENGPQRALLVLGDGRVEDRREMLALIEALGGGRLGIVGSDGEYDYYEVQGP